MFIGFSWLRFLSRLAKAGLGIVTFGGTRSHLSPYTFKQVVRGTLWARPIGGALWARPAASRYASLGCGDAALWGSQSWLTPSLVDTGVLVDVSRDNQAAIACIDRL